MNEPLWKSTIRKYVDWIFRVRTVPTILITSGVGILGLTLSPLPNVNFRFTFYGTPIDFSLAQEASWLVNFATLAGLLLIAVGTWLAIRDHVRKERAISRQRRIAIEIRGLNTTLDRTLEEKISSIPGPQILANFLDARRLSPKEALKKITSIPEFIEPAKGGKNDNDIEIFVGGLAPVPFLFVAGSYLTSQSTATALDWNRDEGEWKTLNAQDDGIQF